MTKRLILSYLAVTLFTLMILEIPLGVFFAARERERLSAELERDATVLGTMYEDALDNAQPYSPEAAEEYAERTGARVVVVDATGHSIVDTANPVNLDFSNRPEIQMALAGGRQVGQRRSETLGGDLLYAAVPIASGGVVHGAVRLTFDPTEVEARIRRYWWVLAGIGVVVVGAATLVGFIVARSVSGPIREMREAAVRAGAGDLSVRIKPVGAPPEINDLADRFNQMAAELEDLLARQRDFVADASHQLRTPLTAIRLRLENLETEIGAAARPDVEAALAETHRLADLVDGLLALARSESSSATIQPADLALVVAERVELWQGLAGERNVTLVAEGPTHPVRVRALAGSLDQILDNLLSNALAATPAGSTVTVRVEAGATEGRLSVIDRGPGMNDAERARAFDRFWRGDHTRPGTGLGLAVVRKLAEAASGTAVLESAKPSGLMAVVSLPLA